MFHEISKHFDRSGIFRLSNVVFLVLVDQIPNQLQVIKLILVETFPNRKRVNNGRCSLAFGFVVNLPGKI